MKKALLTLTLLCVALTLHALDYRQVIFGNSYENIIEVDYEKFYKVYPQLIPIESYQRVYEQKVGSQIFYRIINSQYECTDEYLLNWRDAEFFQMVLLRKSNKRLILLSEQEFGAVYSTSPDCSLVEIIEKDNEAYAFYEYTVNEAYGNMASSFNIIDNLHIDDRVSRDAFIVRGYPRISFSLTMPQPILDEIMPFRYGPQNMFDDNPNTAFILKTEDDTIDMHFLFGGTVLNLTSLMLLDYSSIEPTYNHIKNISISYRKSYDDKPIEVGNFSLGKTPKPQVVNFRIPTNNYVQLNLFAKEGSGANNIAIAELNVNLEKEGWLARFSATDYVSINGVEKASLSIEKEENYKNTSLIDVIDWDNPSVTIDRIKQGADINATDENGNTPLILFTYEGEMELIEYLISVGANLDIQNNDGETALLVALDLVNNNSKKQETAELLINAGANLNAQDQYGYTALHKAILKSDATIIKKLLASGANGNIPNSYGETPLIFAVGYDSNVTLEMIQALIAGGVYINKRGKYGETALYNAIGNPVVLKTLLKAGANVNISDENKLTPLHAACQFGYIEDVLLLLEHNAHINATDEYGQTPLITALEHSNFEAARLLVENGAKLNAQGTEGRTALMIAIEEGQVKLANLMIEKKQNLNLYDEYKDTAVSYAVWYKQLDILIKLIAKGADVNISDYTGESPLYIAAKRGMVDFVEVLIDAGANVHQEDVYNDSIFHSLILNADASEESVRQSAQLLLNAGVDINKQNKGNGFTALMLSTHSEGFTEMLLKNGADTSIINNDGDTAMHIAISARDIAMVKWLIAYGDDLFTIDSQGRTPLMHASSIGELELVLLLIDGGADTSESDREGNTALDYARRNQHTEVIELLAQ